MKIGIGIGILVALVIIYLIFWGNKGTTVLDETSPVSFQNIVQEVSVTGTVEADPRIGLQFQQSGQLISVPVKVGDYAKKGQILAQLDTTSLEIAAQSAEADLALAQANYNKMVAGSTPEAILVAQATVVKAEADLYKAKTSLENTELLGEETVKKAQLSYESAQTDYDNNVAIYGQDIIHAYEDEYNIIDDSFNEIDDTLRKLDTILGVDNPQLNNDFEVAISAYSAVDYRHTQNLYSTVKAEYTDLRAQFLLIQSSDYSAMDAMATEMKSLLNSVSDLLDETDALLVEAPAIGDFTDDVKDADRALIVQEVSDISGSLVDLTNAMQVVETAFISEDTRLSASQEALNETAQILQQAQLQADIDLSQAEINVQVYEALLAQAQASLAQTSASPRPVDLAGLQASITNAEAALELANYNLSLASLTAPTSGVVTQINGEVGENVSQSEDFLVMISDQLQIVANVSETDIGKVKLGNKVALTLDAFSFDQLFEAEIIKIDPAETVIQGVIYYQVTAMFDKQDNTLIKPGMTANMAIITAQKDHVLAIPIRAVKYDEARTYVLIQNSVAGGEPIEVDVTLGIRGDQYVEILSGLKENDKVITYLK